MLGLRHYRALFSWPVIAAMLAVWIVPPISQAQAAIVSTDAVMAKESLPLADNQREKVIAFLAREDVQQQMHEMGVSADEAQARVNGMSDAEVAEMAGKIETLPSGQNVVLILLVVVLIILIWPW